MKATFVGIITILIWASGTTLIYFSGNVSPFLLSSFSFFISGVLISFHSIYKKNFIRILKETAFKDYMIIFLGYFFYTVFLYISFKEINPLEANILNYLWPLFLGFLVCWKERKTYLKTGFIGIFIGFVGVFLIFYDGDNTILFNHIGLGHILALSAAIIWAFYSFNARTSRYEGAILAPIFIVSGFICLFIEYIYFDAVWPQNTEWIFVILLGLTRLSYMLWEYSIREGNALLISSLSYCIPLVSTIFLYFAGVEVVSSYILLSVILIVIGCLVTNINSIQEWFKK